MAKDSAKRKNISPRKSQNKKAKYAENQQDTLTESEESEIESSSKNMLSAFNYNNDQLFELFILHGIPANICIMFQGNLKYI